MRFNFVVQRSLNIGS